MADPGLVKRMVEDGWGKDAAVEQVDALMAVIQSQLLAGKTVRLDGIGQLRAPSKVAKVNFPPRHLREQRKIELRSGALLVEGEPYPDPRVLHARSSTYGR